MESLEDRSTPLVRTLMAVWIPSEEEKQRIADGRPVLLWVWGIWLPPVAWEWPSNGSAQRQGPPGHRQPAAGKPLRSLNQRHNPLQNWLGKY